tara:strand:- start:23385 stop:23684 length:300 start_codon:yes stop_codon:yes gene_type:complete
MSWPIVLIVAFLSLLSIISTFYAIRFGLTILKFQDAIESSLDILDERYSSMYNVLQTPLFYDSPEIRRVLTDIEKSRDAILYVANSITRVDEAPPPTEE